MEDDLSCPPLQFGMRESGDVEVRAGFNKGIHEINMKGFADGEEVGVRAERFVILGLGAY